MEETMSRESIQEIQDELAATKAREEELIASRAAVIERDMEAGTPATKIAEWLGVTTKRVYAMRKQGDYFTDRARFAMMLASAPDAPVGAIAAWARDARSAGNDARDTGIIVDKSGQIQAHTRRARTRRGSHLEFFIEDHESLGVKPVLDLGMSGLSQKLGRPLIHLTYHDLATGAGPK